MYTLFWSKYLILTGKFVLAKLFLRWISLSHDILKNSKIPKVEMVGNLFYFSYIYIILQEKCQPINVNNKCNIQSLSSISQYTLMCIGVKFTYMLAFKKKMSERIFCPVFICCAGFNVLHKKQFSVFIWNYHTNFMY